MNSIRMSRGHTQAYLRQLLTRHGLMPRTALGQCFLTDLNLLDILVDAADLSPTDFVLEIGAGTGSLTQRLAARAGTVLSVEIDRGLFELAQESTRSLTNLRILHTDILRRKNALHPDVLEAIEELAPPGTSLRRKVVANLPYAVATPVICLLLTGHIPWERIVVTIQKELADRLIARPSTKDYGSLSVIAQSLADIEILRELPPSAFWPRPKVWSAFIKLVPSSSRRATVGNLLQFCALTRAVLVHRRKVLRTALHAACANLPKDAIDNFLASLAIDPHTRAESLEPQEFVRLSNHLPTGWLSLRG